LRGRTGRAPGRRPAAPQGLPLVTNAVMSLANLNAQVETFLKEVRQA
jgi:hypothetical protein